VPEADIIAVRQIAAYSITSSARAEIDGEAQTWLAAQLGSRTELLPVTCFEFFISELTSNACPNPRT
jgi:hypothetical protein